MLARRTTAWATAAAALAAVTVGPSAIGRAAAGEFLTTIDDLPLMPGLAEDADAGLAFDKPGGRVVEAYALGPVDRAAVFTFYAETLPGLGWRTLAGQAAAAKRWQREGEELELHVLDEGPPLVLRFYLRPN